MKNTSVLVVLACMAMLLSGPLAALADDAADSGSIVLSQLTQKAKPNRGGTGGSV